MDSDMESSARMYYSASASPRPHIINILAIYHFHPWAITTTYTYCNLHYILLYSWSNSSQIRTDVGVKSDVLTPILDFTPHHSPTKPQWSEPCLPVLTIIRSIFLSQTRTEEASMSPEPYKITVTSWPSYELGIYYRHSSPKHSYSRSMWNRAACHRHWVDSWCMVGTSRVSWSNWLLSHFSINWKWQTISNVSKHQSPK